MRKIGFLVLFWTIIVSMMFAVLRGGPEHPAARESRQANPPPAAAEGQTGRQRILRLTACDYTVSVSSNGAIIAV